LELRRVPACHGSGYIVFFELYLDRKYEGYIGFPERVGAHVMMYGRPHLPESHTSDEIGEFEEENTIRNRIARILHRKTG